MSARKYLNETGLASLWAKIKGFFVKKSGDTMTGGLTRATELDPDSGATAYSIFTVEDVNAHRVFNLSTDRYSGKVRTTLATERYINNVYKDNYLTLSVNGSGDPSIDVSSPSAWRSALELKTVASSGNYNDLSNKPTIPVGSDYVLKAGDTMTGDLVLSSANLSDERLLKIDNATNAGSIPSLAQYCGFYIRSKDGKTIGKLSSIINPSGNTDVEIYAHGFDSNGNVVSNTQLHMYANRDGSHSIGFSYPQDWANALIQTINASDFFVSTSGVTDFYAYRMGKLIIIDRCVFNKSLSASGTTEFAQIKSEFRPPKSIRLGVDDGSSNQALRAFMEPITGSNYGHITTNLTTAQSSSNYFFLYNFAYIAQ